MYAYIPELHYWPGMGLLNSFPMVCYMPVRQSIGYLLNITSRFDWWSRNSVAVPPVLKEIDLKKNFNKYFWEIIIAENNQRTFSNTHAGLVIFTRVW